MGPEVGIAYEYACASEGVYGFFVDEFPVEYATDGSCLWCIQDKDCDRSVVEKLEYQAKEGAGDHEDVVDDVCGIGVGPVGACVEKDVGERSGFFDHVCLRG